LALFPSGQNLGLGGADELDVAALRDGSCETPQPLALPPAPAPALQLGDAIRVESSLMEQRLVTRIEPTYPNSARLAHIEGDVRLQVRIAADGSVQNTSLISGPPQLVAAAVAAVKQWKYQPMMLSEHPVPVVTVVNVKFRLASRAN
jgi:protein TonB